MTSVANPFFIRSVSTERRVSSSDVMSLDESWFLEREPPPNPPRPPPKPPRPPPPWLLRFGGRKLAFSRSVLMLRSSDQVPEKSGRVPAGTGAATGNGVCAEDSEETKGTNNTTNTKDTKGTQNTKG